MKRKKKKKGAQPQQKQQVRPEEEYTVDEILSQFWQDYEEPEFDTEEADAAGAGAVEAETGLYEAEPEPYEAGTGLHEAEPEPQEEEFFDLESILAAERARRETGREEARQEPSAAEDAIPLEEFDFSFTPFASAGGAGPAAEAAKPGPEAAPAAAAEPASEPAAEEAEPEEIEELNFDLPYSIRDIMQEFWNPEEPAAEEAAPEEPEEEPAHFEYPPAEEGKDDSLDFSLGALLWGREEEQAAPAAPAREAEAVKAPESSGPRTVEAAPAPSGAAVTAGPEAGNAAEAEAPQNPARPRGRRLGKVWEDFPDTPQPSDEPFVDTLDYGALFKLFAEEPEAGSGSTSAEPSPGEKTGEWPENSGLDAEALLSSMERPETGPSGPKPAEEETPLLADRDGEMDFRDILREFMLGDQHPIYSGTPGIDGKPAPGTADAAEIAEESKSGHRAEADAEDEDAPVVRPFRRHREYTVQEDFPLDAAFASSEPEAEGGTESAVTVPDETAAAFTAPDGTVSSGPAEFSSGSPDAGQALPDTQRREKAEDSPDEEPEESGFRSRLKTILAGRSLHPARRPDSKKALNEPGAYVGYEDYLPDEAQAKAAADAAAAAEAAAQGRTGGAHTAPADGELPEGFGAGGSYTAVAGSDGLLPDDLTDEELLDYEADFPSFGQWILNSLMNVWIKLNGVGDRQSTATMEDEREDPGPEMNVAAASRYYGSQVTMLRMRFQLGLALLAVLAYITLGFPVSGMLKTAKVASAVCLGLQLTILLLCLDVVVNALMNIFRGRFGADGLALLACVVTSFDALVVAVGGFGTPHIPLCLFSSLALMGILFSSLLSARALRKSIRVPAIGRRAYCVTAEEGVRGGKDITLLKSIRPVQGFVRRAEEAPPDETFFNRFAVLELLAVLLLSLLTGLVKHSMRDFLYILSAMLTCTVPVTALLAFALPYFVGSQRMFSSGAAVAGWSGVHDIGASRNLIVTDRDLFPEDSVSIETVRVFADESAERVIAYAGTMIAASGSGLGPCFSELMERNGCRMRRVEDFQWLSGGGLQGRIEGHTVLCGSSDLMQLMNVKVPYRLVDRTTVLLSIDGVLYGIFKVSYTAQPEIRSALQELIASNRHPIFAIRDFNVTPDMLHEVFDVATDGYDFPPYGDRFRISEAQPSETSKVSGVICREGLGPLTHLADTGRSMYVAVRLNLMITILTAVLGTLLVFIRLIGPGILNAWLPFVLMLLDLILVTGITVFMRF